MECTFIKPSDNPKLGGNTDRLHSKAAILKDRNGLEKWANKDFTEFKGDIRRIPHHRRRSLLKCCRLGTVWEADVLKGVYPTPCFQCSLLIRSSHTSSIPLAFLSILSGYSVQKCGIGLPVLSSEKRLFHLSGSLYVCSYFPIRHMIYLMQCFSLTMAKDQHTVEKDERNM